MLSQEGGWNTAMRAAGTLCVPVTWIKKEHEWSATLWDMILLMGKVVIHRLIMLVAMNICLHYSVSVASNFGDGTRSILSQRIQCTSDNSIFSNCSILDRNTSQCQHAAGVICEGL